MTISVGIIGTGVMGADHARILASQVAGVRLHAVTDTDPGRARSVADATGADHVAANPMALINDPGVDAILIASPDQTHRELTLACLAARKPVLCEKPLAPTARECLDVLAAEVALGRRLVQVGYMRRFDPAYVEMKATLQSGRLGRPLFFHCIHRNLSAPPWFDSRMAITNSAVHEIDIARWLLEDELESIQVFRPSTSDPLGEVSPVFLVITTAQGRIVNVENNNNGGYGYDVRGELACEKGSVSLHSPVNSEISINLVRGTSYAPDWRQRFAQAYRQQLQAWVNSVTTGVAVGASAWDGYAASTAAEAGLKALAEGLPSRITMEPRPALYA
ncbi:Gfo/Idh/MocA family oxidoreductase [Nordella sp. HKS 07]|uniref:Gfo/Idh/MocA family protein n=1 Tax=Nordella sp. HKS 07 TaxID=2712222 RepID=UPI0013E19188|nr:Gfo/Idh/MocA family oxidoreductase [Nordella sp. HKS 07]QIG52029.1 Gfo/Idh/MocA family oxidoreductase [Nordella sp. HKS 07]